MIQAAIVAGGRGGETLMAYPTKEKILDLGTPERREAFLRRFKL